MPRSGSPGVDSATIRSAQSADDSVVIDTPGIYDEPGSIATAPQVTGDLLPTTELVDLDGQQLSSADLIGAPMVVNFWFKDCAPCAGELPAFAEVHAALGDQVRFVGIDPYDTAATAEDFARGKGVGYELLPRPGIRPDHRPRARRTSRRRCSSMPPAGSSISTSARWMRTNSARP